MKPNNQPEPFGPVPFGSNNVGSLKIQEMSVIILLSKIKKKIIKIKKSTVLQKIYNLEFLKAFVHLGMTVVTISIYLPIF